MLTRELASFISGSHPQDIPESIRDEAVRAIVNWLGCALGGSLDSAVDTALDALGGFGAQAQATLIGRGDRVDLQSAALLDAVGSQVLDFADAHPLSLVEPAVPVAAALFPLAEHHGSSGADVVHAFILGAEIASRAGLALGTHHLDRGWQISGTCGVLGAAAACAKLLGLDSTATMHALGIAATQAGGIAETLGTPSQCLEPGFAARNGLMAALLAAQGFTAAEQALEGRHGYLSALAAGSAGEALLHQLGETWELSRNVYKSYPCSILLYPVIDGCVQLRREHGLRPREIAGVGLRVHPLVLQHAGQREPQTGLQARRSVHHAAAAALLDGSVGLRQFRDDRVAQTRVADLRARTEALADPELAREEVHIEVALRDGRSFERRVRRGRGSLDRPLTDAELSDKFRALAAEVLATDQAERLLALAWNIRALGDVGALIRSSVPEEELEPHELPGSPLIPR